MSDRDDLDRLIDASEKVLKTLAGRRTSGGVELTDETMERLAAEAEAGYDTDRLKPRPTIPLVYPAGLDRPEDRWVYMGECKYCASAKPMRIFWKLTPVPGPAGELTPMPGTGMKVVMRWWPYAQCEGCEHVSQGQVTHTHDE